MDAFDSLPCGEPARRCIVLQSMGIPVDAEAGAKLGDFCTSGLVARVDLSLTG